MFAIVFTYATFCSITDGFTGMHSEIVIETPSLDQAVTVMNRLNGGDDGDAFHWIGRRDEASGELFKVDTRVNSGYWVEDPNLNYYPF